MRNSDANDDGSRDESLVYPGLSYGSATSDSNAATPCDAVTGSEAAPSDATQSDARKGWPSRRLPQRTRFFVIKSFSARDLNISMQRSVWATQPRNEQRLNEAYNDAEAVVLFFSVNESRAFQGYARMASRTGEADLDTESDAVWTGAESGSAVKWGSTFKVKWQTIYDLPFGDVMHLKNPYNENKPIKISRDGQEVEPSVGHALCSTIDEGYVANPSNSMKRRRIEELEELPPARRPKQAGPGWQIHSRLHGGGGMPGGGGVPGGGSWQGGSGGSGSGGHGGCGWGGGGRGGGDCSGRAYPGGDGFYGLPMADGFCGRYPPPHGGGYDGRGGMRPAGGKGSHMGPGLGPGEPRFEPLFGGGFGGFGGMGGPMGGYPDARQGPGPDPGMWQRWPGGGSGWPDGGGPGGGWHGKGGGKGGGKGSGKGVGKGGGKGSGKGGGKGGGFVREAQLQYGLDVADMSYEEYLAAQQRGGASCQGSR